MQHSAAQQRLQPAKEEDSAPVTHDSQKAEYDPQPGEHEHPHPPQRLIGGQ